METLRKGAKEMNSGIYFNSTTKEITSVTDGDLGLEDNWTYLTNEARLGLLAIRSILRERGLVDDDTAVYWYLPQPSEATGSVPRCDVDIAREPTAGWRDRLRAGFRGNRRPPLPTS